MRQDSFLSPPNLPPMRAAILTRVSTEEQVRSGLSLEFQEAACRAAALKAGATSIEVFADGGFSGSTARRPALTALRSRLADFDVVYCWKLDRLARNVKLFADLMEEFAAAGVGFVSVTEGVDYSGSSGRLMMHMLAAVAAFFVDLNKERVRAALRQRALVRCLPHASAPYGYRYAEDALTVDWGEAPWVAQVFGWYAEGTSQQEIARLLNEGQAPQRRQGAAWTHTHVRRMLANATYLGLITHRGETVPGAHEPLVEATIWRRVQARLQDAVSIPPRSRATSLSPLLRCGHCGAGMGRSGHRPGAYQYRCLHREGQPAAARHPWVAVGAPKLEDALWAYVESLFTEKALTEVLRRHQRRHRKGADTQMQSRLEEVDIALERNLVAYRAGGLDADMLGAENRPLLQERDKIRETLARGDWLGERREQLAALGKLKHVSDYVAALREEPGETQVRWLRLLVERVEVWPARLVVHHTFPELPPAEIALPRYYAPRRGHRFTPANVGI